MLTLGEIVRRSARPETFGRKVALVQGSTRVTYAEVNERSTASPARSWPWRRQGDRVGVLGRNSIE